MTKEEADAKVREARDALVEAFRTSVCMDAPVLVRANAALLAAEAARAALDEPRVQRYTECHISFNPGPLTRMGKSCDGEWVKVADILAKAEKLETHFVAVMRTYQLSPGLVSGAHQSEPAILLSDLRKLFNGKD